MGQAHLGVAVQFVCSLGAFHPLRVLCGLHTICLSHLHRFSCKAKAAQSLCGCGCIKLDRADQVRHRNDRKSSLFSNKNPCAVVCCSTTLTSQLGTNQKSGAGQRYLPSWQELQTVVYCHLMSDLWFTRLNLFGIIQMRKFTTPTATSNYINVRMVSCSIK